jgi:MPBQ/MSBQ methyltransferase
MDALKMEFEDDSFDYVWACESGEHMPDKKRYIVHISQ